MINKYDNYQFQELQNLVEAMRKDLEKLQKDFADFQRQEQAEVTKMELEKSKISASDPEFAAANQAWLNRRSQSAMSVRQMNDRLRQMETELRYAQEALDRKIKAQEQADQVQP